MSQSTEYTTPSPELLPDEDHTLIQADKLVHGKHNPRFETPKSTLKQSIEGSGINRPLIVWYDSDNAVYHITDGWQRYQAATEAGWEVLPAVVYDSVREALDAARCDSAGRRPWNPYDWAQYCQSLAEEIKDDDESETDVIQRVADAADLSYNTVRRYLHILTLPEVIHPLLIVGPDGSTGTWSRLKSYNADVKQYSGLTLKVADQLATHQSLVGEERIIGIAAYAVEFSASEDAIEFVEKAVTNDSQRLDMIQREVFAGSDHHQYIIVPRVAVKLPDAKRRAVMDHCHQQRRQLSDIVSETITSLAEDLTEPESDEE
jgi:ParB/RepB/Spo0J family partition protein